MHKAKEGKFTVQSNEIESFRIKAGNLHK